MIKVRVWNEYLHEHIHEEVRSIYPQVIHQTIVDGLKNLEPRYSLEKRHLT